MKLCVEEKIHLNDLSFIQLCIENYGINKGIYNTIDAWFYEQGIKNILERRRNILLFLEFVNENRKTKKKFGNGGLSIKLQQYFFEKNQKNTALPR